MIYHSAAQHIAHRESERGAEISQLIISNSNNFAVMLHPVVCFGYIKAYSVELSTAIIIIDGIRNNAAHA